MRLRHLLVPLIVPAVAVVAVQATASAHDGRNQQHNNERHNWERHDSEGHNSEGHGSPPLIRAELHRHLRLQPGQWRPRRRVRSDRRHWPRRRDQRYRGQLRVPERNLDRLPRSRAEQRLLQPTEVHRWVPREREVCHRLGHRPVRRHEWKRRVPSFRNLRKRLSGTDPDRHDHHHGPGFHQPPDHIDLLHGVGAGVAVLSGAYPRQSCVRSRSLSVSE